MYPTPWHVLSGEGYMLQHLRAASRPVAQALRDTPAVERRVALQARHRVRRAGGEDIVRRATQVALRERANVSGPADAALRAGLREAEAARGRRQRVAAAADLVDEVLAHGTCGGVAAAATASKSQYNIQLGMVRRVNAYVMAPWPHWRASRRVGDPVLLEPMP